MLETNVHFPTDLNLLHDAGRKSIELVARLSQELNLSGWRKYKSWRKQLKRAYHKAAKWIQNRRYFLPPTNYNRNLQET